jgi:hypothetical protein
MLGTNQKLLTAKNSKRERHEAPEGFWLQGKTAGEKRMELRWENLTGSPMLIDHGL